MRDYADPVGYYETDPEGKPDHGAGWYFFDEIWCSCYGPYPTEEEARQALENYCKECL